MVEHHKGLEGTLVLEPGAQGLAARMLLLADALVIETDDGERHSWHPGSITASHYDTRTTELNLDGTTLFFQADDPLEFADRLGMYLDSFVRGRKTKSRSKKRSTHEHSWIIRAGGGGITRRICTICRHVSIDLTEAYEIQADPTPLLNLRR